MKNSPTKIYWPFTGEKRFHMYSTCVWEHGTPRLLAITNSIIICPQLTPAVKPRFPIRLEDMCPCIYCDSRPQLPNTHTFPGCLSSLGWNNFPRTRANESLSILEEPFLAPSPSQRLGALPPWSAASCNSCLCFFTWVLPLSSQGNSPKCRFLGWHRLFTESGTYTIASQIWGR